MLNTVFKFCHVWTMSDNVTEDPFRIPEKPFFKNTSGVYVFKILQSANKKVN